MKPRIRRDRGSWLAEVPGFRAYDATPWKAWFRLRLLVARRAKQAPGPVDNLIRALEINATYLAEPLAPFQSIKVRPIAP